MIIFDLRCAHGHRFEGWFASGDAFTEQQEKKLVRCPVCDDDKVERVPSARVHVGKSGSDPVKKDEPVPNAAMGLPPEVLASLREIVRKTEDVGDRFAEEARKIHYEETPKRSIRGRATKEDAEALREEGIEFAPLPPFLTGESH
ncbi:MAG: DUF1178 family protein [Burkholderiales bacterium]